MNFECQSEGASSAHAVACVAFNARRFVDVFGIIGNILCICINLNPRLRRAPTSIYLSALAFYDLMFLIGVIPLSFKGTGAEKLDETKFGCRISRYIIHVAAWLSTWTVTAFSVERFIVVYFPLHRVLMCTIRNTIIILLCLIPFPLLYNSYMFFMFPNDKGICDFHGEHSFLNNCLKFFDTVAANLIPLIAILTLNGLIAFRMRKNAKERKENQELRVHHSNSRGISSNAVSRQLIIVSTTFAILNIPLFAIRLKMNYLHAIGSWEEHWTEFDKNFVLIAVLLYHLNFALDFLLYNFASNTFRTVARDILVPKSLEQAWHNQLNELSSVISSRITTPANV